MEDARDGPQDRRLPGRLVDVDGGVRNGPKAVGGEGPGLARRAKHH